MIRFSFLSKLLMFLAVLSAVLNLLHPGFRTYYGLSELKAAVAFGKGKLFRSSQKAGSPKPVPAKSPKDCEKMREYDRLILVTTHQKPKCDGI